MVGNTPMQISVESAVEPGRKQPEESLGLHPIDRGVNGEQALLEGLRAAITLRDSRYGDVLESIREPP